MSEIQNLRVTRKRILKTRNRNLRVKVPLKIFSPKCYEKGLPEDD